MPTPAHSSTTAVEQSTSIPDSDNLDPSSSGLVKIPFFIFVTILLFIVVAVVGFCVWLSRHLTKPLVSQHTKPYGRGMTRWREWKEVDIERVGILRESSKLGRREMTRAYGSQDSIFKRVRFSEESLKMEEGRGKRKQRLRGRKGCRFLGRRIGGSRRFIGSRLRFLPESSMRDERARAMKLAVEEEARRLRDLEAQRDAISESEQDENPKKSIESVYPEVDEPMEGEYLCGEARVYFRDEGMRHIN